MSNPRSNSGLDGIVLIDKAPGWTSHDVVAKARRIIGQKRIGHTGTLDPLASGLLVLCLGQATRLVEYLTGHDKHYSGVIRLGITTTTDDAEGEVTATHIVPEHDLVSLETAFERFRGGILQRPPAFSALKVDGKRAYDLARGGAPPDLAPRPVTIRTLTGHPTGAETVAVDVRCSSGTYIRSLARDIGAALGCGAHLASLRRESAGPFEVREAVTIEDLANIVESGRLADVLRPPDEGIADLDVALLCAEAVRIIANGGWWRSEEPFERASDALRIYSDSGEFVGIGTLADSGEIRPSKVFRRPISDNPAVM